MMPNNIHHIGSRQHPMGEIHATVMKVQGNDVYHAGNLPPQQPGGTDHFENLGSTWRFHPQREYRMDTPFTIQDALTVQGKIKSWGGIEVGAGDTIHIDGQEVFHPGNPGNQGLVFKPDVTAYGVKPGYNLYAADNRHFLPHSDLKSNLGLANNRFKEAHIQSIGSDTINADRVHANSSISSNGSVSGQTGEFAQSLKRDGHEVLTTEDGWIGGAMGIYQSSNESHISLTNLKPRRVRYTIPAAPIERNIYIMPMYLQEIQFDVNQPDFDRWNWDIQVDTKVHIVQGDKPTVSSQVNPHMNLGPAFNKMRNGIDPYPNWRYAQGGMVGGFQCNLNAGKALILDFELRVNPSAIYGGGVNGVRSWTAKVRPGAVFALNVDGQSAITTQILD